MSSPTSVRHLLAGLTLAGACAMSGPVALAQEPTATTFPGSDQATGAITGGSDGSVWTPTADGLIAFDRAGAQSATFTLIPGPGWIDVAGGPDGRLWAGGQGGLRVANLLPFSGVSLIGVADIGAAPVTDVAPGPDGNVWFTVPSANRFGFVTPGETSGSFEFVGSAAAGRPISVATGGDGALWFTKSPSAGEQGSIVRRDPVSGALTAFTAGLPADAHPSALALGPDGNLWFSDASAPQVGRITPAGAITMFPAVASADLIAGPDGNLWLAGGSTITTDGAFTRRTLPPDRLAVGADGNIWGVQPATGTVWRLGLGGQRFSNPARITVPESGASGKADLYPSPITVGGLEGTVTKVTARLNGVHHRVANDLQVMLVGPSGQSTVLMADVTTRRGDTTTQPHSFTGESIAFTAAGRVPARRITSGVFSPIDPGFTLTFDAPAPAAPSGGLAQFAGTQPNGTWNLFVVDSEGTALTTGAIAGGWSLDIETTGPPAPPVPPTPTPGDAPAPPPITGQNAPRDTAPPKLRVTGLPARTSLKALLRGLRVRVTPDEPVRLTATVAIRRTSRGAFGRPLFTRTSTVSGPTTLRIAPRITGRFTRSFRARVRLVATDSVGNRSTTTRTITVRP